MKMNSNIKQVSYLYNAPTGNVKWIVEYKTGNRKRFDALPKTAKDWLQSDKSKLVQIGDTEHGAAWHVERWAEA